MRTAQEIKHRYQDYEGVIICVDSLEKTNEALFKVARKLYAHIFDYPAYQITDFGKYYPIVNISQRKTLTDFSLCMALRHEGLNINRDIKFREWFENGSMNRKRLVFNESLSLSQRPEVYEFLKSRENKVVASVIVIKRLLLTADKINIMVDWLLLDSMSRPLECTREAISSFQSGSNLAQLDAQIEAFINVEEGKL